MWLEDPAKSLEPRSEPDPEFDETQRRSSQTGPRHRASLALLRNQAIALLRHEKIETTMPKAKELRPFVERLITIARRGVAAGDANGKTLHARRLVLAELPDTDVVGKLFETLAPRFADRPGGYTRILRVGYRRGDSAEVAHVELVGSEYSNDQGREGRGRGRSGKPRASASASGAPRSAFAAARARVAQGAGRRTDARQGAEEHDPEEGGRVLINSTTPHCTITGKARTTDVAGLLRATLLPQNRESGGSALADPAGLEVGELTQTSRLQPVLAPPWTRNDLGLQHLGHFLVVRVLQP